MVAAHRGKQMRITGAMRRAARMVGLASLIHYARTHINFTSLGSVHGRQFKIPNIYGMRLRPSEPWMAQVFQRVLPLSPGLFVDAGVNVGQTLLKLRALDQGRPYLGFEPNPMCVLYVQAMIKSNRFANATLVPAGLFEQDDVLKLNLFSEDGTDSTASVIRDFRPESPVASQMLVPVLKWNTVERALGCQKLGVVKIDVEGAELEVLRTLKLAIERDRPLVFIEILPVYGMQNASRLVRQEQIETLFAELDYRLVRIRRDTSGNFSHFSVMQAPIGVHSDRELSDYLVAPSELVDRL